MRSRCVHTKYLELLLDSSLTFAFMLAKDSSRSDIDGVEVGIHVAPSWLGCIERRLLNESKLNNFLIKLIV